MAKFVLSISLMLLVAQACCLLASGESLKSSQKRALLIDNSMDYDEEFAAVSPTYPPPPPPVTLASTSSSSNSTNTTVSKNSTIPVVKAAITFAAFTVDTFDATQQSSFITLLTDDLEAAGYNVKVLITNIASGSVVVSSTTEFLDGSSAGAAALANSLTTDANSIFPVSTYGTATAIASVSSTSNSSSSANSVQSCLLATFVAAVVTAISVLAF